MHIFGKYAAPSGATASAQLALPVRPDLLRAFAYCWIVFAALFYAIDQWKVTRLGLTDGIDRPLGWDFINSWSGAFLAWHGKAQLVYDWNAFHAFQQSLAGGPIDSFHYSYPPSLLALTAPFAFLPYVLALAAWLIASWLCFYAALRLAMPREALLLSLATPALFINAIGGQNGAWSAALLGGGLGLLERRPVVAGMLFGLFVYKPHLALLIPVALIAGRQWRALIAAGFTAVIVIALSVVLFGPDLWADWLRNVAVLRVSFLERGDGVWHRMISVFVFTRHLGFDLTAAYGAQMAAAVTTAALVGYAWLRNVPVPGRNALLVLGTFLVTPYLHDYDLVVGAFVAAWLMVQAEERPELQRQAFLGSALILLMPLLISPLAKLTGFSFGPVFIVPVFLIALRMAFAQRRATMAVPAATAI
jgi:arabinofuranan 3-O-arabinosyltransferase